MNKILYFFTRKYNQVRKVIRYLPAIWRSHDFDYMYAVDLFYLQLEDIANYFEANKSNKENAAHSASRIRMILRLMDKVYDEEYGTEYQKTMEEKYGAESWEFTPYGDRGLSFLKITNECARDEEHQNQIDDERSELFVLSYKKQQRAHKLLWDLVEHNIRHWWD